jgi:sensor histidine kinase YesM
MTQIYEMTQIIPVHVQKEQVIFEYTIMLILLCMCIITVSLINFIICIIVMRNIVEIKIQQINKQIHSIQEEHQETIEQINKQILSIQEQEEHQEHQEQQQKKITNI